MSPSEDAFDVVVVGAGTAGLAAAKAADAAGARVAVVDQGPLGTFCARKGCMPSKIVLHSAAMLALTRRLGPVGVDLPGPARLRWPAVRERTRALVADFAGHVVRRTEASSRFTLVRGRAAFLDAGRLHVDGEVEGGDARQRVLTAGGWVVATGSVPRVPPLSGLDAVPYLVSDDVFELDAVPPSVAVLGGGAVGIEMGQLLARAGARVHLIEATTGLAGLGEGEPLEVLATSLARELTLHRRTTATAVAVGADDVLLTLRNGAESRELRVARLLVATGRRPALEALALERAGVQVERGVPSHDRHLRTTNPAVFVAGDAAGPPALLHTAALQGRAAGHNAARPDDLRVPPIDPPLRVVFSDPAVATVGLDPDAAARAGHRLCVARRAWGDQGKARIIDETQGVAQLVVDAETRKVLGCQLVGPHADLLIHLLSYAMQFGATVDDLLGLHHYHPTLAEMVPSLARIAAVRLDRRACDEADIAAAPEMQ
jgi:dihydrolipoamide dehydrogenase